MPANGSPNTNAQKRSESGTCTTNHHWPHSAVGDRPPASKLHAGVTNVLASCS